MTSLPIMWYGCFDFEKKRKRKKHFDFKWDASLNAEGGAPEGDSLLKSSNIDNITDLMASNLDYDKHDYLENADLYRIGLNRVCFSKTLFVQWIFYALW